MKVSGRLLPLSPGSGSTDSFMTTSIPEDAPQRWKSFDSMMNLARIERGALNLPNLQTNECPFPNLRFTELEMSMAS
jgi:hypothetical protein